MAEIHLVEGPVGSGKSTFGAQLSQRLAAPQLVLDDWMATLFRPDRPDTEVMAWYLERKERCIQQIWQTACAIADLGGPVVLELGLIQKQARLSFYNRVDEAGHELTVHVIDAPREVRQQRVRARNEQQAATFSMVVPDEIFEMASDVWQPPDAQECEERRVILHTSHAK